MKVYWDYLRSTNAKILLLIIISVFIVLFLFSFRKLIPESEQELISQNLTIEADTSSITSNITNNITNNIINITSEINDTNITSEISDKNVTEIETLEIRIIINETYKQGDTILVTTEVTSEENPIKGANVTIKLGYPSEYSRYGKGLTNEEGIFYWGYKLGEIAPIGNYFLYAKVEKEGYAGSSAFVEFNIIK